LTTGKLYLIPCPISEHGLHSISPFTIGIINEVKNYVVEKTKTARRFFKTCNKAIDIDAMQFFELDKEEKNQGLNEFLNVLVQGFDVGVVSEAGCPAIADPGNRAVAWAHNHNIQVIPLAGPSSIIMALIASGMNGQQFSFHGYVPIQKFDLNSTLKKFEVLAKQNITQIFMDTPYRNAAVLEQCISVLHPTTQLCIACDLDSSTQFIKTMSIANWKNYDSSNLHKRPAVFLIGKM
jgi:16S rRNA (cytidine1402-2'-O)-methyltransferase